MLCVQQYVCISSVNSHREGCVRTNSLPTEPGAEPGTAARYGLRVVSLGVGTKFMPAGALREQPARIKGVHAPPCEPRHTYAGCISQGGACHPNAHPLLQETPYIRSVNLTGRRCLCMHTPPCKTRRIYAVCISQGGAYLSLPVQYTIVWPYYVHSAYLTGRVWVCTPPSL